MSEYDAVYRTSKEYRKPYAESAYYRLWQQAVTLLPANHKTRILELGCGSGQFAAMLKDLGYTAYTGIDSSAEAVKMAQASRQYVVKADAFRWLDAHPNDYDIVIALETFEHLDDRQLLAYIRPGATVIFSVPNFPMATHQRHFATANKVRKHYASLLTFSYLSRDLKGSKGKCWYLARATRTRPRILAIMPAYNEMDYLPVKMAWCKRHGLDPYVIDNYSTDGTWGWLKRHGIKSHRLDTGGAFALPLIQAEILATVKRLADRYDWSIYLGVDLFFESDRTLDHAIAIADAQGYNLLEMRVIGMFNTGESRKQFDPFNVYLQVAAKKSCYISLIHKVKGLQSYNGDAVVMESRKVKRIPGISVNMGMTKPAAQREETMRRRILAFQRGLGHWDGRKYKKCSSIGWKWSRHWTRDIRTTEFWPYYQKLQELKW